MAIASRSRYLCRKLGVTSFRIEMDQGVGATVRKPTASKRNEGANLLRAAERQPWAARASAFSSR